MKKFLLFAILGVVSIPCWSRAVEESVVSVYKQDTTSTGHLDVYSQIATNIAEKITSPFYRFFNVANRTEKTTPRPFEHIELEDLETNRTSDTPRDIEELSLEAMQKPDKKPEKITLFSSYLPIPVKGDTAEENKINLKGNAETGREIGKLELNDTSNEIDDFDDDFGFDDVDEKPRDGFSYILELIGSILQLLWGGFLAIFKPAPSASDE